MSIKKFKQDLKVSEEILKKISKIKLERNKLEYTKEDEKRNFEQNSQELQNLEDLYIEEYGEIDEYYN